jgi:glycosyltransferase involved in cell wall biosynthesis
MPGHVAFVPLRYGRQIVGGSEALSREMAIGLAGRGWEVEVLTTRAVDHQSMANELPEGLCVEDGLRVRRFSSEAHWSLPGFRAQQLIQDGVIPPVDDQWTWLSWRFSVPDLFHFLLRHGAGYDAVIFSPYLFWNATACLGALRGNAVTMPCLHDETYARLAVVRPVMADADSVWFLSEPEHQLAHRLGPLAEHHTVTGAGMHVPDGYDPDGFRRRFGLERPFLLYAGRREKDKGWDWLLDTYAAATRSGLDDVDLVTFGSSAVAAPDGLSDRVHDLGFLGEADRDDAFAAALAYVQPSRMESFSRTVMEAWLARTPVLFVEGSEVVGWHCRRSGAGAPFAGSEDLVARVRQIEAEPDRTAEMAEQGRRYVLAEYSWPVVLDRLEADLAALAARRGAGPR